jgi:hypothetical protein
VRAKVLNLATLQKFREVTVRGVYFAHKIPQSRKMASLPESIGVAPDVWPEYGDEVHSLN